MPFVQESCYDTTHTSSQVVRMNKFSLHAQMGKLYASHRYRTLNGWKDTPFTVSSAGNKA